MALHGLYDGGLTGVGYRLIRKSLSVGGSAEHRNPFTRFWSGSVFRRPTTLPYLAIVLLGSDLPGGAQGVLQIVERPAVDNAIGAPIRIRWEVPTDAEYRYKLSVPGDWKFGVKYLINRWSPWATGSESVSFDDFVLEGTYRITIEARRQGLQLETQSVSWTMHFVMPELLDDGLTIDWSRINGASNAEERYTRLADEYGRRSEVLLQEYEAERKVLKASWSRDELITNLNMAAGDLATGQLLDWATTATTASAKKVFAAASLYDVIKQTGVTLILIAQNVRTNRAAFGAITAGLAEARYRDLAAGSRTGPCGPGRQFGVTVLFVNGIWNTKDQANQGCGQVGGVLTEAGVQANLDLVYNRSTGKVADLAEAAGQYENVLGLNGPRFARPINPDADLLRGSIERELAAGREVVVIGHSQGNLMFQEAVLGPGGLDAEKMRRVKWLALAAPAMEVEPALGDMATVFLAGDVLRPLRNLTPSIDAGAEWFTFSSFMQRHYLSSYLTARQARQQAVAALARFIPANSSQETSRVANERLLLVLDLSGSMNEDDKLRQAQKAALDVLDGLPSGTPVGLITFGSTCGSITNSGFSSDLNAVRSQLSQLRAGGPTPLASAMDQAAAAVSDPRFDGPTHVVVISDGAETCRGDVEAAAKALGEALQLHTVGGAS